MTDTWNDTRPILHAIERYAEKSGNYAAWVGKYMGQLPARPDFDTRADEAMAKAEDKLRIALATMKAVREHYKRLPVTAFAGEWE